MEKKTLLINFYGGPGCGKSTICAGLFYQLKILGYNCEMALEFAKDKVWEESNEVFKNQSYIFGKQSFRMTRCADKVDVIITDSPLPLSILYNNDKRLTENFNKSVMDVFNSYDNVNYLLIRTKPYNPSGRIQTEEESNALGEPIKKLLSDRNIEYKVVNGECSGYEKIVDEVLQIMKKRKK